MKYQINKTLHKTFKIFEKNKLSPRAYAVPYSSKEALSQTAPEKERYLSDTVKVLSGEWDFKFYKSISAVPDKLDTLKVRFDKITLPCDWQRTGYQEPVYINCPYEIKTMAPEIPEDMPVGVYRKLVDIENTDKEYIISFLGASNNIALYVNGKFVGYSEGSHNTAEFNITSFLTSGTNELVVVMFKWCNGTFLECQDMFRENGIFRDVLLYVYDKTYLYDYKIESKKCDGGYKLTLDAFIEGATQGYTLTAELLDKDGKTVAVKECAAENETKFDFGVLDIEEWNPEIPVLYTMYITLSGNGTDAVIRNFTGFRTIEIKDGVFLFNNKPIKVKGVNHHDTDLYKGFTMSIDDMIRDVQLMKSLNVNGVRTSHYPPDPFFITLADIYGLYIIDEADIETHGCWDMAGDIDFISHDLKWAKHYVDRVKRMYHRDRNHPSIIMWSLGNEAGGYKCHDKCYQFLKATGTDIPVHYEGVVRTKRFHYDVISEMYTSTEEIEQMMKNKRVRTSWGESKSVCKEYSKYPFYLCEYCHAMGVGPGNLEEYWDLFYEWDNSMGGCIWEWADHAVYHPENDKKYKYKYTYGGDHGEKYHDGHFCVDGLVYADRNLHTGAKEMKVVYRPVRAALAGKKLFCFENTNRFRASDYIKTEWVLLENGTEIQRGEIDVNLAPMQSECFTIDHKDFDESKDCHINFIYTDKETGAELAVEQLTINDVNFEYDIEIGSKIAAETENGIVSVLFENGKAVFDGKTGELTSYTVNGKEILNASPAENRGFTPNLFRALIDNDAKQKENWENGGLDALKKALVSFDVHLDDGEVLINSVYALKAKRKALYESSISYIITSLGAMEVKAELKTISDEAVRDIPRFGLTLEINRDFDSVTYYGRGDSENMPDFKCQAPMGIYRAKVDDMYEMYVYPQESGMHCDTKWIELSDNDGDTLTVYADSTLAFSVHHFTQTAVHKAQHQEDVSDMNTTFLTLDGALRGIGTSSCGPDTREEYRLDASKGYSLSFTMIPKVK